MQDIATYGSLTDADLRLELIECSRILSHLHTELGILSAEQHKSFLTEYIRSPGNSVSAKNREAEYNTRDLMEEIINNRAMINALMTTRDLVVFLLLSRAPTPLDLFPPATLDSDGLLNA